MQILDLRERGAFTLIEILIAIGVFTLLISLIGVFFREALISYQRAKILAENYQNLKRLFFFMSKELSSAVRAEEELSTQEVEVFKGEPHSLFFLYPDSTGLKEIGYVFFPQEKSLVKRDSSCDFNFDTFDKEKVLSSNIEKLSFSFFNGTTWQDTSEILPSAVKIKLTLSYKTRKESYEELINIPAGK